MFITVPFRDAAEGQDGGVLGHFEQLEGQDQGRAGDDAVHGPRFHGHVHVAQGHEDRLGPQGL